MGRVSSAEEVLFKLLLRVWGEEGATGTESRIDRKMLREQSIHDCLLIVIKADRGDAHGTP